MAANNTLSETISDPHLEKIKELWSKSSSVVSPARVQKHHSLLDARGNIIYSEQAIQRVLDELKLKSAQGRPTADNRAAQQLGRAPPAPPASPSLSKAASAQSGNHIKIRVEHEDSYVSLTVSPDISLSHLKGQLMQAFDWDPDTRVRLGQHTTDGWGIISSDEALAQALADAATASEKRTFQVRLRTAESSSQTSSSASTAVTITSAATPPRKLTFEDEREAATTERLRVQKQWEYETKLRQHIVNRVTAKLEKEQGAVGSANVTSSIVELRTLLRVCSQLVDEWTMFLSERAGLDDGIQESQLLTWYIGSIIDKFHPTLAQLWHSSDPSTSAKRLPSVFPSFEAFLAQVYLTVKPGISGAPTTILPAMLTDLQGRWRSFTSRRAICGELRQMLLAVQFLQDNLFSGSSGDLSMTIKVFLESALSAEVQTSLIAVLKQSHSADLPMIFQDSDDFAQIQAYQLESVLRRWSALDTLKGDLTPGEFTASPSRPPPRSSSTRDSTQGQRGASAAGLPAISSKEFQVTVDGQVLTFRQNLAAWSDQTDRTREEQKFLEAVYKFDGSCHYCHQHGHRAVGCPAKFKLDPASGQDLNPKSYFYTLIPPRAAMVSAQRGGGSRGASSNRQSRGGPGRPALAAVLETVSASTARMETQMELLARERQRDHDRVEQVAQQLAQQLGNGRAGAAQ